MLDPTDRAAAWAAEARALGMSYGQYVAKYHPPEPPTPPTIQSPSYAKTCPECGQVFRATYAGRVYCCESCYRRYNNRNAYLKTKEKESC